MKELSPGIPCPLGYRQHKNDGSGEMIKASADALRSVPG
jgi:hypothetical protein